jgi:hypothetical protein
MQDLSKLNKGVIDPLKGTKYLGTKKGTVSLKKVEIQSPVQIGKYLLEKGDTVFVEMEEVKTEK